MKYFESIKVRLLKNHHPEDYEDEWLDKGKEVYAQLTPDDHIYLATWSDGRNMSGCFNSDAKEGIDFEII